MTMGYLKLLDWSSRLLRSGKKSVSRAAAPLLERLRIDADSWAATLRRFFSGDKLVGNFFGSATRLKEAATTKGRQWLKDLGHRSPQHRLSRNGFAGSHRLWPDDEHAVAATFVFATALGSPVDRCHRVPQPHGCTVAATSLVTTSPFAWMPQITSHLGWHRQAIPNQQ